MTVVYQTVVTPTKAGKLKLGEVKLRAQYSGPRANNRYDPFPGFGRMQEMELTAPAIEFEVLPALGEVDTLIAAIADWVTASAR